MNQHVTELQDTDSRVEIPMALLTPPSPLAKKNRANIQERTFHYLSPEEEVVGNDYFGPIVGSLNTNELHRRGTAVSEPNNNDLDNLMFSSEKDASKFPDGGKAAYIVLLGLFFGLVSAFGIPNSLGAVQSYVLEHQLRYDDQTSVSWVFSLHLGVMYFGGVIFGEFFDRYGARIPNIIGGILTVLGLILTAELTKLVHFIFTFAILTAIGTLLSMCLLIGVLLHWFLRKRAMACSIGTIGGLLGGALFPLMLQNLYKSVGFKWALRILAFLCLGCMSVATVLCKERSKTTSTHLDQSLPRRFVEFFKGVLDFKVVTDPRFVLLTLSVWLAELISMLTLTYLSSYALNFGVNDYQAYLLITIVNVCGIPSRLILGIVADKYGRFNVMLVTLLTTTIIIFALWVPANGNLGLLYAFGVLFGISTSAVILLIPACTGQICSAEKFGKTYGTLYFFLGFLTILGMYFASLIIGPGNEKNYHNLIYYEGALGAGSVVAWLIARWWCVGWKWCKF